MHGMFQMKEKIQEEFRFKTRKEYEEAIFDLIRCSEEGLDMEASGYDSLTEEYLRFCESLKSLRDG